MKVYQFQKRIPIDCSCHPYLVESKTMKTIHIVNIHPYDITWYTLLAKCFANLQIQIGSIMRKCSKTEVLGEQTLDITKLKVVFFINNSNQKENLI